MDALTLTIGSVAALAGASWLLEDLLLDVVGLPFVDWGFDRNRDRGRQNGAAR